jgi:hypothetical protein
MRKTNPIWPRGTGIPGRRASQLCDIASMPRFGKQTQFFDCGLCETNPICPPPRWDQRDRSRDIASMPRFGQQSQSRPRRCRAGTPNPRRDDYAKQSQFAAMPRGMGPGGRGTRGVVQTNPIPTMVPIRRSASPGGRIVRSKASLPGYAGWEGQQGHGTWGQMRKTNPILRLRIQRGRRPVASGLCGPVVQTNPIPPGRGEARCTNKPNFPGAPGRGKYRAGKGLWWIGHGRDFGKTKPILHCGLRISDCGLCETKPIPGGRDTPPFHYSTLPIQGVRPGFSLALAAGGQDNAPRGRVDERFGV